MEEKERRTTRWAVREAASRARWLTRSIAFHRALARSRAAASPLSPFLLPPPPLSAMAKKSVNSSGDSESSIVHPANSFQAAIDPARRFAQDSFRLVKRCTKPDAKEFKKIALATTVGFLVMGFLGFFVKLVHIPSQSARAASQHDARTPRARSTRTERADIGPAHAKRDASQSQFAHQSLPSISLFSPSQQHHRWPVSAVGRHVTTPRAGFAIYLLRPSSSSPIHLSLPHSLHRALSPLPARRGRRRPFSWQVALARSLAQSRTYVFTSRNVEA